MEMKKEEMNVGGEEKDKPKRSRKVLVLCYGTDNACLAVPCCRGGRRLHTQMMAIKTSLSRWNEGTRELLQQGRSQLHLISQQSATTEPEL